MSALRVLVTGGSGFVGSSILQFIAERHPEWTLIVADLIEPEKEFASSNSIEFVKTDVSYLEQCKRAVKAARPTVIVHCAGRVPGGLSRYSRKGREDLFELNVGGTRHMLAVAKENSVQAFLFTGSSTCIADDLDHEYPNFNEQVPYPKRSLIYGESKAAAEELVLAANTEKLNTCSLRPSVITGREDYQLIPSIQACIAKGETPFIIGSGDNLYDFTFVDNVAHAHVLAIENLLTTKTCAGEAILISNDQPITFRDFMLAVWAQWDHAPPFTLKIPGPFAVVYGSINEWVSWLAGRKTTVCKGSVKDAMGTRYANLDKAKRLLSYEPIVDIWDGVRISCDALKERMAEANPMPQKGGWG